MFGFVSRSAPFSRTLLLQMHVRFGFVSKSAAFLPHTYLGQSWKKLHAAHAARADIYHQIEDILVQTSHTFVAIADLCCDFYSI
jgi:hypothetical protein